MDQGKKTQQFILSALDVIPKDDDNCINRLPEENRDDVWMAFLVWCMQATRVRMPLAHLVRDLNEMYPDLGLTRNVATILINTKVSPILYVSSDIVRRGLVDAGTAFDTTVQKAKVAESILEELEETMAQVRDIRQAIKTGTEADIENVLGIRPGTNPEVVRKAIAAKYENIGRLGRLWKEMTESIELDMETFGLRTKRTQKHEVDRLDFRATMDLNAALDKYGLGDAPIDVQATETEPQASEE